MPEPKALAIIMQAGDFCHLHAMVSLAATAASSGRRAHIFLTHEALHSFLCADFEDLRSGFTTGYAQLYDSGRDDGRVPDLERLLGQARQTGRVRLYGCSASVAMRQGYSEDELKRLDGIVGHTTFLRWALDWQLICL